MSKLTREVKYLNESDRPKKVEPLEFSDWMLDKHSENTFNVNSNSHLNKRVSEYATYLQEFSAEEVPVEFMLCVVQNKVFKCSGTPDEFEKIYHAGIENEMSVFVAYKIKSVTPFIYYGKLNSGRFNHANHTIHTRLCSTTSNDCSNYLPSD